MKEHVCNFAILAVFGVGAMCPKIPNQSMSLAGDADGKSLCKLLGLSEGSASSSGAKGCTDNVETQMTDEGLMDEIAEKHRASHVSMDLESSPETGKMDGKQKPSELPVVVHPNSILESAVSKQYILSKQDRKMGP